MWDRIRQQAWDNVKSVTKGRKLDWRWVWIPAVVIGGIALITITVLGTIFLFFFVVSRILKLLSVTPSKGASSLYLPSPNKDAMWLYKWPSVSGRSRKDE